MKLLGIKFAQKTDQKYKILSDWKSDGCFSANDLWFQAILLVI